MQHVRSFHDVIASRSEMKKGPTALLILARQVEVHEATIKDAIDEVKTLVIAEQRDATRLFIPEIKDEMNKIYTECGLMKGKPTYPPVSSPSYDWKLTCGQDRAYTSAW